MSDTITLPDPISRVNDIRERILAGQEVTASEMRVILDELRQGRKTTHEAKTEKKAKTTIDLDKLFDDLGT